MLGIFERAVDHPAVDMRFVKAKKPNINALANYERVSSPVRANNLFAVKAARSRVEYWYRTVKSGEVSAKQCLVEYG